MQLIRMKNLKPRTVADSRSDMAAQQMAEQVTDKIEQWFEDTDVDGLNVAFAISPGDFEDIADMLVPELANYCRAMERKLATPTLFDLCELEAAS